MRTYSRLLFAIFLLATLFVVPICNVLAQGQQEELPTLAFPGAEGYGRFTTGGRGGAVYHVTSLADDGSEGTLRWACSQTGRRTIVFDVCGTIHLTDALKIRNGALTIAGQTAPGQGICVADYPVSIGGSNVIVRYVRFRLGKNTWKHGDDALEVKGVSDIVLDHCSVSWGLDENLTVYGVKRATVQWCISANSLWQENRKDVDNAEIKQGGGCMGGIWGGEQASFHHNLIAHHRARTPKFGTYSTTQGRDIVDYRNNVVYNWGDMGCYGGEGMHINMVSNYYKPGDNTALQDETVQRRLFMPEPDDEADTPWGSYYIEGNVNPTYPDVTADNWDNGVLNQGIMPSVHVLDEIRLEQPCDYVATTTHTALAAFDVVLRYAGASRGRDWQDATVSDDTRQGKASWGNRGIIGGEDETMGTHPSALPELVATAAEMAAITDSDGDGIPDVWEAGHGLNPDDAADGAAVGTGGYTNLELYMNSLVADITDAQNAGGEVSGLEQMPEADGGVPEDGIYRLTLNGAEDSQPAGAFTHDEGGAFNFNKKFAPATYGGITFTKGLKMEGATVVKFTTAAAATVTIVQSTWTNGTSVNKLKLDSQTLDPRDATAGDGCLVYTIEGVGAGPHTITRDGGESGLLYVQYELTGSANVMSINHDDASGTDDVVYSPNGQRMNDVQMRGVFIRGGNKYLMR